MLRSSWKRGVVVQCSGDGAIRICKLVRVPVGWKWVIVIPVADFTNAARRSKGGKIRCWRLEGEGAISIDLSGSR